MPAVGHAGQAHCVLLLWNLKQTGNTKKSEFGKILRDYLGPQVHQEAARAHAGRLRMRSCSLAVQNG